MKRILSNKHCSKILLFLVLTFCVWVAMGPGIHGSFLNWDDDTHLYENPLVESLSFDHIRRIFTTTVNDTYIPLTIFSFAIEFRFVHSNPFLYHFDNFLLHLIIIFLIVVFALQLGLSVLEAGGAALLFGIHPMHVESVAWITERKDVLYSLFYLLALIQYVHYLKTDQKKYFVGSLVCGVLSMLAKPMALSLPLILFFIDWYWKRKFSMKVFLEKSLFFLVVIPLAGITYALNVRVPDMNFPYSPLVWIWTFSFYLIKFFLPMDLTAYYVLPKPVSIFNVEYSRAVIVFCLFWIGMLWGLKRNRWLVFAGAFYFFSVFFLLRFDDLRDTNIVADRFMYLPSLGICLFLSTQLNWIRTQFLIKNVRFLWVGYVLLMNIIVFLIFKSHVQSKIWDNNLSFWNYVIDINPNISRAHNHRGVAWVEEGKYDLAIADFSDAIKLNPKYPKAYCNRGDLYYRQNKFDLALNDFNKTLELDPRYIRAYSSRGIVYSKLGRYDLAISDFSKSLELNPNNANDYNNRAIAYKLKGKYNHALLDYNHAIGIEPQLFAAYINRGRIYVLLQQFDLAIVDFSRAIELKKNGVQARFARAKVYFNLNKFEEALEDYQEILKIDYNNSSAHYQCALVYIAKKDFVAASQSIHQAKALGYSVAEEIQEIENLLKRESLVGSLEKTNFNFYSPSQ